MGSGKNGTFDKTPDWQQWAVLTVQNSHLTDAVHATNPLPQKMLNEKILGKFIAGWWAFFSCETCSFILEPIEGHGLWDGKAAERIAKIMTSAY
ncbi:MAG: hypothetical protein EOO88_40675 [Pedobacter sp.]|nr:MAG: hypothetical protein EOO88_40675 [Pedobacter sp.]